MENNRKTVGTIDFRFFLGAIKKYYNFRYTDQIWWDNHHFSPFYGWFLLFEIYGHYIGFRRGAPSQNWNIFRTDARMTPKFFRNASNRLLWKVWKFHMASDYRFCVIQNKKIGGRFFPLPVGLMRSEIYSGDAWMKVVWFPGYPLFWKLIYHSYRCGLYFGV